MNDFTVGYLNNLKEWKIFRKEVQLFIFLKLAVYPILSEAMQLHMNGKRMIYGPLFCTKDNGIKV